MVSQYSDVEEVGQQYIEEKKDEGDGRREGREGG